MKAPVYDLEGKKGRKTELPEIFDSRVNSTLINRAFWIMFTHNLQPQGRDPMAGMKVSALSWNTGHGMSRIARIKGAGTRRAGQAGGVAGVVKGRLTHPPTSLKVVYKKINKREKISATMSALAATASSDMVSLRGHKIDQDISVPIVLVDEFESLSKTKDIIQALLKLKLNEELERVKEKGVGPLIVTSTRNSLYRAANNISGLEAVTASDVSVLHLAPGGVPGRLAIYTKSSLKALAKRFDGVGAYGR
ncbi:MAG: 50S ribosomal protein L4 [Nitrososphaerota archaeon]|jgi:large subunit ribosomal protein L4e|nr:50S ribosomal protein L4 [Nitrososphaerota archaeon]MDG6928230.1 50S ribosomal protein L4 [Nitrososphaerota archaeon]MDG6931360.1 50S ribosomal protein L4 [Nitrososphaerota archaeon]MDG6932062.1 50S ribosomal protein L4 [Nitrososphaerota archaeon]MDG6935363.1 50S ribosomal protein L4 [Nitrososphaerota archaeon]